MDDDFRATFSTLTDMLMFTNGKSSTNYVDALWFIHDTIVWNYSNPLVVIVATAGLIIDDMNDNDEVDSILAVADGAYIGTDGTIYIMRDGKCIAVIRPNK
jgi:hypothetical protein